MTKTIVVLLLALVPLFLSPSVFADSSPDTDRNLVIHFIDVGQGDASFVQLPDGTNMLIDAGSPAAGPKLAEYLRALKIRRINRLILTHPHDDHIGGIFSLLSAFEIDRFYDNGFSNFDSSIYFDYVTAVRKNLLKYSILQAGESMTSHAVRLDVLNPLLPPTGNVNNDSVVVRLIYNDIKILFAGDISAAGTVRLLKVTSDLNSQVMKAAHHGANDAITEEFLDAVRPEAVILSTALINRYARPHQGVLERLFKRNINTYRTDHAGNIILRTDGRTFSIVTEK